jgi:uncharacterized membrane protein
MGELALAGLLFLVTHLGISSTPLRGWLVGRVGQGAYLGLYSLIAAVTLGFLVLAYNGAPRAELLWMPSVGLRWAALLLMPVAMIFMLGGFLAPNPTGVGMEGKITSVGDGVGMTRITRHPLQWSFVLWAIAHLLANGDLRSLLRFGSVGTVSLLGSVLMDRKKAGTLGDDWARYAAATSNVPFAAVATGRNRLVASELVIPVLVGLVGYGLALWGHEWLSGVPLF